MPSFVQFTKDFYPDLGGIATVVDALIQATPEYSHTVYTTHLHPKEGYQYVYPSARITRVKNYKTVWSLPIAPVYPFGLWSLLRTLTRDDIVVYHYPFPLVDISLPPIQSTFLFFFHAPIQRQRLITPILKPFTRALLKKAHAICVTNPILTQTPELKPYQSKIQVISQFVTLIKTHKLNEKTTQQIIHTYTPFMLTVGRLVTYKGHQFLIQAMKNVPPPYQLVIIGTGHLYTQLQQEIQMAQLQHRVHILQNIDDEMLTYFLTLATLFVFPSITTAEALGTAQIQAMAEGLPIINCMLHNGVNWAARPNKEALSVPPKNPKALTKAMCTLLANESLRKTLGTSGKKRAHAIFDIQNLRNTLSSLIQLDLTHN